MAQIFVARLRRNCGPYPPKHQLSPLHLWKRNAALRSIIVNALAVSPNATFAKANSKKAKFSRLLGAWPLLPLERAAMCYVRAAVALVNCWNNARAVSMATLSYSVRARSGLVTAVRNAAMPSA